MKSLSRNLLSFMLIAFLGFCMMSCGGDKATSNAKTTTDNSTTAKTPPMDPTEYKFALSHYTGWEMWIRMMLAGEYDYIAKKHGVNISFDLFGYIESMNVFTTGEYDGVVMTNMDALIGPAAGGINCEAGIIGDWSNGNDACVIKTAPGDTRKYTLADIVGSDIYLVQGSVSEYAFYSKCRKDGIDPSRFNIINVTDETELPGIMEQASPGTVMVTWNPVLMTILEQPNIQKIFTSADLPGEIVDIMFWRKDLPANVKTALSEMWYTMMEDLKSPGQKRDFLIAAFADQAGCTVAQFKQQLKTTNMFYTRSEAVNFVESEAFRENMEDVRNFCLEKGLLPDDLSDLGVQFPDGEVLGSSTNVKLSFTSKWMKSN